MTKSTPLFSLHEQASARFVDFHGWNMPINYGSQIEEHHQVRTNAGVFDVSHMTIVDVKGPQTIDFLRYLLANDVARLTDYKAMYSCMLNEQAGVVDDLIAYRFAEDYFRLVVNSATREKDLAWINQHSADFDVTLTSFDDLCILAIQGPKVLASLSKILTAEQYKRLEALKPFTCTWLDNALYARTGYTGEDGFEVMLPIEQAKSLWQQLMSINVQPCGLASRDTLRLESGLNLYGNDMDETTHPLESNLSWTVPFEPADRNFIGRAKLEQIKQTGVDKRLVGLILKEKGVLRTGQKVVVKGVGEGVITSGGFSPNLNQGIAMARIPRTLGSCFVEMRGKLKPVEVVKLPFVRRGKVVYKKLEQEKVGE